MYKENLFFAEVPGRKNVVCFRNMANWITSDQWYDNKRQNADDEAKRIIETAAKIIKHKLKEFLQSNATGSTTCLSSNQWRWNTLNSRSSSSRARNWVVKDVRLKDKGSRFKSDYYLCAEVSSLH